jgi:Tol biopolymer transport system component
VRTLVRVRTLSVAALTLTIAVLTGGARGAGQVPVYAVQPSWSSDGTRVAFIGATAIGGRYDVYVVDRDGHDLTNLTAADDEPGYAFPAWSPDGTLIASGSELGGPTTNHEVYSVTPVAGGVTQHVARSTAIGAISWSYDGRWLAIDARDSAIVARSDGSAQRTVAAGACCGVWSPRTLRLAVSIEHLHGYGGTDIYLIDAGGRVLRRLTAPPKHRIRGAPLAIDNTALAWSRDGSRLLFSSERTPQAGLYVMRADGSRQVRVATSRSGDISPRGTAVVYTGKGIWVVGADGKHRHQVSPDGIDPRWSPDGQWIAYSVTRSAGMAGIDLVRPDGTQRHTLAG